MIALWFSCRKVFRNAKTSKTFLKKCQRVRYHSNVYDIGLPWSAMIHYWGGGGLSIAKRQAKLMLTSLFCFTMYRLVIGRFFIRFFIQRMCNMNMNSEFTIYQLICRKYTIVWPNLLTPYWVVISGLWPYVIEIVSLEYIMLFFRSFKNYLRIYKVASISRRYTFALLKQTVVWQLIFFFF